MPSSLTSLGDVGMEMPLDEIVSLGSRPPRGWGQRALRTLSPEHQGFKCRGWTTGSTWSDEVAREHPH